MLKRFALSVCLSITTGGALADDGKSDLGVTLAVKNSSQILYSASGKSDLETRVAVAEGFVIEPVASDPFQMVPELTPLSGNEFPTGKVSECAQASLSSGQAKALVVQAAEEEGFDVKLALAVAESESGWDANALSEKGAFGLMQLMKSTATEMSVDRCDPSQNARGGIRYLKRLVADFGNPVFALAAYNAGPENVIKHKGVPPFDETVKYIARVLTKYYGAPKRLKESQVATLPNAVAPVKIERPSGSSDKPAGEWASGFVMHLN
jgi:hypothetical protein